MIDVKTYGALPPECDIRNMSAISYVKFIFSKLHDFSALFCWDFKFMRIYGTKSLAVFVI